MAISGKQTINIGLPNEAAGSDSLYTAFNKTKDNFDVLFNNASPYNNYTGGVGISATANANTGTVTITNTGVTNIIAGTNIVVNQSNGDVTISSTGGGNGAGGTVTSVNVVPVSNSRIVTSGGPIVNSGNITVDLASTGVTPGTYTYPTVNVDSYGRIITISNAVSVGTVTSVGINPGNGIQVTGGPVTTAGNMTIVNTGVTRLNAGPGISLSGSNGNVTVSVSSILGAVTSVGVSSNTLTVSGSPITSTGVIVIDLPSNISVTGNVTANNIGNISSIDLDGSSANVLFGNGIFAAAPVFTGTSGFSGFSGVSGFSGASGISGFSGSGISGFSGFSGISGFSGFSGQDGTGGTSGFSGISGYSGLDGVSGFSGISGYSGLDGVSGFSGISGYSGLDGVSGISGYSGAQGIIWTTAPVANNSAGIAGEAAYDSGGNLYVCVATNTWSKFTGNITW